MVLQLAHSLNKSSAELCWCAATALTWLYLENHISPVTYTTVCVDAMRSFMRLYGPRRHVRNDSTLRISFNKEYVASVVAILPCFRLSLPLYNHWTLYDSVQHDAHFITSCKLWTQNGAHKLKHVFARLGYVMSVSISLF